MSAFTIAQISDIHCGSPHFVPSLLERAIAEINELQPNVVVVSGDLTADGFREEYELAREYIDRLDTEDPIVIPGNHDSRNVGYVHFEELFGERRRELHRRRRLDRRDRLDRAGHRPRHDRPRAVRLDRGALRLAGGVPAHLRTASPPAAGPRDGPRAQRRARRGRRARVPLAQRGAARPLGPQARPVRVAARGPVRRQRGNRVHQARPRQDEALLQRDRGDARKR